MSRNSRAAKQAPSASEAPSLQTRKQQLVRAAIWDAAMQLFSERGYGETTIDDIAFRAGISRRSFFRYFSSRADLMAYGVVDFSATLVHAIESCPPRDSPATVFRKVVFDVTRRSAALPLTGKIMQIAAQYPEAREAQFSQTAELHAHVEQAFAQRCSAVAHKDFQPAILASLLLSVIGLALRSCFEGGAPVCAAQDIDAAVENVLATIGLLVSPYAASPSSTQVRKRKR